LKVDKSFIGHEREESKSQILGIIKEICSKFNMKPIIEGVENKKQLHKISDMGYTLVQGYIYTEPIPLKDFMLA
jgi:EAL domain-containing protein (putative c-di-GMP-specific phosphodiesterase class I)